MNDSPWPSSQPATRAMLDVIVERFRQVAEEGFTTKDDDLLADGTLAIAGACYAVNCNPHTDAGPVEVIVGGVPDGRPDWMPPRFWGFLRWPWEPQWWKPKSRRQNLVRGAALIIAEIERIDRAAGRNQ